MGNHTTILIAVVFCLLAGCATQPPAPLETRRPTPGELQRAAQVTRDYVLSKSLLSPELFAKLKPDAGFVEVGGHGDSLHLQFYDPLVFPEDKHAPDGLFWAMDGGFPSYFRATVDLRAWRISDFYGCNE